MDTDMINWKTFSFYMSNAPPEVVRLQKQVFEALNEPLEQVQDTCSHGEFLTRTVRQYTDSLDAVVFFDLDCIPLKAGVVEKAVRLAVQNKMVIGCAQQANHIEEAKLLDSRRDWPTLIRKMDSARIKVYKLLGLDPFDFKDPFIYAGPCFLVIPSALYTSVGEPTLAATSRTDVAGELTIACRERDTKVICLQPTFCHVPKYKLGNAKRFGLGTVYGNCVFHAFETSYLRNTRSARLFRKYCQQVIREASMSV